MKTIGMIGGMSWESSIEYYRFFSDKLKIDAKFLLSGVIASDPSQKLP